MFRRDRLLGALAVFAAVGACHAAPGAAQKRTRGVGAEERSLRPADDTLALNPTEQAAVLKVVAPFRPRTRYETLLNGGRITLVVVRADTVARQAIRSYLHDVMTAFRRDDFERYFKTSTGDVPGRAGLRARRSLVVYEFRALPWGGEVYLLTGDSTARESIRQFIQYQRLINTPS